MDYSPKLKQAMEEIKAILNKHDIAGVVVLHAPDNYTKGRGHGEFLLKINPSYSCASIEDDNLRIKAKVDRDFGGDKKAQHASVLKTTNMAKILLDQMMMMGSALIQLSEAMDSATDALHGPGSFRDHPSTQN